MSYTKYLKFIAMVVLCSILVELVLRIAFGFCDTVLFQGNKNYEYIAQPNQSRQRFGSHIAYNAHSMRSATLDSSAVKILCFGDSVINGGVLTDQDALATTLLGNEISKFYNRNIQFLNISAGSWGPDNCYAYLKEKGDFNAKLIILFVNSHDAYDSMNFEKVIDVHPSYPSHQYALAIYELWDRYLYPRLKKPEKDDSQPTDYLGINKKNDGDQFNDGFKAFIEYSKLHGIPLIVYLHAEQNELEQGVYNEQGQQIITLVQENNVPLVTDLNLRLAVDDFRDNIHLNEKGQKNIAFNIFKVLTAEQFGFLNE
tara:strand:- start:7129 stop:8067 length:939 start_codon:yes stop_codon:yes gene_type:complete